MRKRRAGGSTRQLVFKRRLVFLQRNRWRLFAMVAGYGLLSATIGLFVPEGWWSGAYWGAAAVGLLWAISWFVSLDGSFFIRARELGRGMDVGGPPEEGVRFHGDR